MSTLTLSTEARDQLTALAEEAKTLDLDGVAEDLRSLAQAEPPVVSQLLARLTEDNLPVDLSNPNRQLVDLMRDLRELLARASSPANMEEAA